MDGPKAYNNIRENMPKSVGARTHPWFTPPRISKGSDVASSYLTMPSMLLRKEEITLSSFGGQPILSSSMNSPLLLIRSNALIRSMNATYSGLLCSRHFSCSCRTENIMPIVSPISEATLKFGIDAFS